MHGMILSKKLKLEKWYHWATKAWGVTSQGNPSNFEVVCKNVAPSR